MTKELNQHEIEQLLIGAKSSVRILGTTLLPIDWEASFQHWNRPSSNSSRVKVQILAESDNTLFSKSFTADTASARARRSYESMRFARDKVFDEFDSVRNSIQSDPERVQFESCVGVQVTHLPVPMSVVEVDGALIATPWLQEPNSVYISIEPNDPWFDSIRQYMRCYFHPEEGGKYIAHRGAELLELFDHKRSPRGIYPRNSFYDTDYSQLVVWALIFDRTGKVLIHRRAENAKDNQSMWDKSVGGHVDFSLDTDTSRAVLREAIEELFTDENKHQATDLSPWQVNDQDVLFLGEWRPDRRRRLPFKEISSLPKEWVFFRVKDSQHLYSPRTLPSGRSRRLRVIADVFLFVAGPGFTSESLGALKNSEYKLLELSELKSAMDQALRGEPTRHIDGEPFDSSKAIPEFTPDLVNIMTGDLRGILEEFSEYIKSYIR